jgi:hypothetical protein
MMQYSSSTIYTHDTQTDAPNTICILLYLTFRQSIYQLTMSMVCYISVIVIYILLSEHCNDTSLVYIFFYASEYHYSIASSSTLSILIVYIILIFLTSYHNNRASIIVHEVPLMSSGAKRAPQDLWSVCVFYVIIL